MGDRRKRVNGSRQALIKTRIPKWLLVAAFSRESRCEAADTPQPCRDARCNGALDYNPMTVLGACRSGSPGFQLTHSLQQLTLTCSETEAVFVQDVDLVRHKSEPGMHFIA